MKDLAVLVSDKNMEYALQGILTSGDALGIRTITHEIRQHAGRDEGVRTNGAETLSLLKSQCQYALLMLDWEGSGTEHASGLQLEQELDQRLAELWGSESKTIVIEPELDVWVWGSDNVLAQVLGWSRDRGIRDWLAEREYMFGPNQKPPSTQRGSSGADEAIERTAIFVTLRKDSKED